MVGRKAVALVTAAALGCASCAGNLRHTTQPNPSAHENWAAVTRLPIGTMLRIEDRSGAGMIGRLVAIGPEEITVYSRSGQKSLPRLGIRQILIQHVHTDWTGIGDVATGALVGGLIGGLAVPKHRWIAGTILAAAGAFTGLILAVMTLFTTEDVDPPKHDEILVYYTDRVAALRPSSGQAPQVVIEEQSARTV